MSRASLLVPILSVAAFNLASGQELEPGVRVRLSAPSLGMRQHTGTLRGRDANKVLVDTLAVPLTALTSFETSQGRKSHTLLGAGIGFLVGGGIGALALMNDQDCLDIADQSACTALGAGIGGLGGAITGALLGGLVFKTERWRQVPLDLLRMSKNRGPALHLALGVSLAF